MAKIYTAFWFGKKCGFLRIPYIHDMSITSISPIDGRYASKTSSLIPYFSEFALIKYRVRVETEYFLALTDQPIKALSDFPAGSEGKIRNIYQSFTLDDAEKVREFVRVTNHDVLLKS